MAEKISSVQAIRLYFQMDPEVAIPEIKQLTAEDRKELGRLAAESKGLELNEV